MKKYTVLSTYPGHRGSSNVGDQLIEVALKKLIRREKGHVEFLTIFREDPLDEHLDEINQTSAILLPAFPIRDGIPLYPGVYRLVDDLNRIKVPLIPVGANWNVYPGDAYSRTSLEYSSQTVDFLQYVASRVDHVSVREYHLVEVLRKHGIDNTLMTGDPAWYDPEFFGLPLHRPKKIDSLVFSPPLSAFYGTQAVGFLDMLKEIFPNAKRYCIFHLTDPNTSRFSDKTPTHDASMRSDVAEKNAMIRAHAHEVGYEVLDFAGQVERLDFYRECDLHVGYECHAHLGFFRQRRPSVLVHEDARGVGFTYTLGVGGFDGFERTKTASLRPPKEGGTSGYCVSQKEFDAAPASKEVIDATRAYLAEEVENGFRRYTGLTERIDETYESVMAPFLRSLP